MRVTDPRWPAVREVARTLLRTPALCVLGPQWLAEQLHPLNLKLSDVQPSRTVFPTHQFASENMLQFVDAEDNTLIAQCSPHEPANQAVWLPMNALEGWRVITGVADDLLSAGYPGCLGCGGPHPDEDWNEEESRSRMGSS